MAGIKKAIISPLPELIDELRYLLRLASPIARLENPGRLPVSDYQEEILYVLLRIFESSEKQRRLDYTHGRKVLSRAIEYVHEHSNTPIRVSELSVLSEVPERTLRYLFKKELGLSPKSFIEGHRLYGVHRELWRAAPSHTRVADVANRWGYWHMGQLAADYRKLFGEFPSDTLNRTP